VAGNQINLPLAEPAEIAELCFDFSETFFPINLSALPLTLVESELFGHRRVAGPEWEEIAKEVQSWIGEHLGMDYPWPGNIRELEQCVRNVMIRREYHPSGNLVSEIDARLPVGFQEGSLSLEEICGLCCTRVYARAGSFVETARRLKIDRRTVKKYVGFS
jgi:DNA-binding NtrC family response regulator